MKRILLAAALIGAISPEASAGQIRDWQDACNKTALENARICINRAATQDEKSLCKLVGIESTHVCLAITNDAIQAHPENW